MKRHLSLKSEHLTELTAGELGSVAGAALTTTDLLTGYYPSLNAPCTKLLTPVCTIVDIPATITCR